MDENGNPKRSRPRAEEPGDPPEPWRQKGDMASLLAAFREDMRSDVELALKRSSERTEALFTGLAGQVEDFEKQTRTELGAQRSMLAELNARISRVEADRPTVLRQVELMEEMAGKLEQTATARASSRGPPMDPKFDRQLDKAVVKLRAQTEISRKELRHIVQPLLLEMDATEAQIAWDGPELSKIHTFKFRGEARQAELRAQKFLQLQKRQDGTWRQHKAKDERHNEVTVYVDGDKNPKQIRTEIITKRAAVLLEQKLGKKTYAKRAAGVIMAEFVPLLRIIVEGPDQWKLEWNKKATAIQHLAKDEYEKELRQQPEIGVNADWG